MSDFQPKTPSYYPPPKPVTPEQLTSAVMRMRQQVNWLVVLLVVNVLLSGYTADFIYHVNQFIHTL